MNSSLQQLRTDIDKIDQDMVELLAKRFALTKQVGKLKSRSNVASIDPTREAQQFSRITKLALANNINPQLCQDILRLVIDQVVSDHNTIKSNAIRQTNNKPSVGIIGLGSFGLLAAQLLAPFCNIIGYDFSTQPKGITLASLSEVASADFVIIAIPLSAYPALLTSLRPILRPTTVLVDICSVKMRPQELFTKHLPDHHNVVFTHPMFGPQSAANGLADKSIIFSNSETEASKKLMHFCKSTFGLKVVAMSADAHDQSMAQLHALTFFIARGLQQFGMQPSAFQAPSYTLLLDLVELDTAQSQDLFETVELGNPFAAKTRTRLLNKLFTLNDELNSKK